MIIANEETSVDCKTQNPFEYENTITEDLNTITEKDVKKTKRKLTGTDIAILVLSILSCTGIVPILLGRVTPLYLISLIWKIPMLIYWLNSALNGKKVSTVFKICYILFVSLWGGMMMETRSKK